MILPQKNRPNAPAGVALEEESLRSGDVIAKETS